MKRILILSMLFLSLCFYGQSITASGYVHIGSSNDLPNAIKSENYAVITIRPQSNSISFSINGNVKNYRIETSNLTDGGSTRKYMLSEGIPVIATLYSKVDLIIFPWDGLGKSGYLMVRLTNDDLRLLGLTRK